jgi:predicted RNase H-like nuclease
MRYAKRTVEGIRERRELLQGKIPGIERLIDVELERVRPWQLLDAASCLWTARRVIAKAMSRLPEDPEWDDEGLRMEIMY